MTQLAQKNYITAPQTYLHVHITRQKF